jgi:hypothetical protein
MDTLPHCERRGDLNNQSSGKKTLIWDNRADKMVWGKFRMKVEVPKLITEGCTVKSSLPVGELTFMYYNLGADPSYDIPEKQMAYTPSPNTDGSPDATVYGDLYQWGRTTDGHEKRNSTATSTLSTTDAPGHNKFI